ncbi:MAG: putative metal-binding motif-containing protein [Deltaproteobacteria bacterium]|nr:putative metal-binding motif-containing protein [Deltaproteobacteria bacterium]
MGLRNVWLIVGMAAQATGCSFIDDTPEGAVLLCAEDAACTGGLVCNLSSHTCVAPGLVDDAAAPVVLSVTLTPAYAKDGDTVLLEVSADEPLADAALVFAPGVPDPGFALALDGARASFSLVIASSTPPGTTVVDAVRLRDLANNEVARAVDDVAFRVDRTPPVIVRAAASGTGAGGLVADVVGYDQVAVSAEVDEPLASMTARFQALLEAPSACAANPEVALGFTCALTASAALPDGDNDVVLEAVDLAGNATSAAVALRVDTAAPKALPGSARALLFDARGELSSALVPGGRLEVEFDVDEELAAPPVVALVVGLGPAAVTTPLSVVLAGRHVRARLASAQPASAGSGRVDVTLVDAVGHTAIAPLALAAPLDVGIPVVTQVPSSCAHVAPQGCPDADGDGALGLDDDCVVPAGAELDCDDEEATVFPGGLEIPGDELDNDCLGDGDAAIDEAGWVFARCGSDDGQACVDGVDEGHAGTRADPHLDLIVALADAAAGGKGVIADGAFYFDAGINTVVADVALVGGVRAELGWQRVPVVDGAPLAYGTELIQLQLLSSGGVADVAFHDAGLVLGAGRHGVRISGGSVGLGSGGHLVDSQSAVGAWVATGASDARVCGGTVSGVFVDDLATATVVGVRSSGLLVANDGAQVTLVGTDGPLRVDGGSIDGYFVRASTDADDVALRVWGGALNLVDSVVQAGSGKALLDVCEGCTPGSQWWLDHVRVELASDARAVVRYESGATVGDGAAVSGCTALGCVEVEGVEVLEPPATGTLTGVDPFARGAPSSAVVDADGACRPALDGSWPIGP